MSRPLCRIFLFRTTVAASEEHAIDAWLDDEERERAARFRRAIDRDAFRTTRATLRRLLGQALGCDGRTLVFARDEHGKPHIRSAASLHFNVSHSHDLAAIALSPAGPLGIDIERIDPALDVAELATQACSARERALLARLDATARAALFYRIWTSKEAYLKARGVGLSVPLDRFEFLPHAVDINALTFRAPDDDAQTWQFERGMWRGAAWALARPRGESDAEVSVEAIDRAGE